MDNHHERRELDEPFVEEAGTEVAPSRSDLLRDSEDHRFGQEREVDDNGRGMGIAALVLSILSLLFLPVLLGTAGIVVGFLAFRRGSTGLGIWAIVIGALSILGSMILSPFF